MKKILMVCFFYVNLTQASMWDLECNRSLIQENFGTSLKGKFKNPSSDGYDGENLKIFFDSFNSVPVYTSKQVSKIDSYENAYAGIGLVAVICDNKKIVGYTIHFNTFLKNADAITLNMLNKKSPIKFKLLKTKDSFKESKTYELDIRDSKDTYYTRIKEVDSEYGSINFSILYLSKDFFFKSMKERAELVKKQKIKEFTEEQKNKEQLNSVLP